MTDIFVVGYLKTLAGTLFGKINHQKNCSIHYNFVYLIQYYPIALNSTS